MDNCTDYRPKHIQEADRQATEIANAVADKFCDESLSEVSDERYEKIWAAAYKKEFERLTGDHKGGANAADRS